MESPGSSPTGSAESCILYSVFSIPYSSFGFVRFITLLTDFGLCDYYVAAMKGVILSRNPAAQIIDISHEIAPQSILSAAYVLLGAYNHFPGGAIHLVVVDPGVGSDRQAIVAKAGQYFFVGPDNGVFSFVLREIGSYQAFAIQNRSLLAPQISNTFHGRDVFAPVVAALSLDVPPQEIGEQLSGIELLSETVQFLPSAIESKIIHIDRFGNCVTGIHRSALPDGKLPNGFVLHVRNHTIEDLKRYYLQESGQSNRPFAIWGSIGFLELSLAASSAADQLGLKIGDPVRLQFRSHSDEAN
jgi:S-adenosyl-L-methionine hydrolase (adenosine-forming)